MKLKEKFAYHLDLGHKDNTFLFIQQIILLNLC